MSDVRTIGRVALRRDPPKPARVFSSGCTLLDLVNGGGWALGRVANIVGDRSAGKTLCAIEACANFARSYGTDNIRYNETEAAFDREYAFTVGLPKGISFTGNDPGRGSTTVEEFNDDLGEFLKSRGDSKPSLYILDSLDALSDKAEMGREIGDATYGTGKAKALSELFRRQISDLDKAQCTLMVISQIRDKIGVMFGETKTRSGGRALDFYSSQIVWLSELKKLDRTVTGVKRVTGVQVLAYNKKNKIGKPFCRAEFSISFNYGIDDELSMVDWLTTNKQGAAAGSLSLPLDQYKTALATVRKDQDRDTLKELSDELKRAVTTRWMEIDAALEPPMHKYD